MDDKKNSKLWIILLKIWEDRYFTNDQLKFNQLRSIQIEQMED